MKPPDKPSPGRRMRPAVSLRAPARRRGGFTLIELLVVVSIIALLIAILLPALGAVRASAHATACLSNMRQISLAALNYATSHNDRLPAATLTHGGGAAGAVEASWLSTLEPYAGRTDLIARCPDDHSPHFDQPEPNTGRLRLTSFATNYYLSGNMAGFEAYASLNALRNPSRTIFAVELAETGGFAVSDHIHPAWFITGDLEARAREQIAIDRHNDRSNYSFLDGSARPLAIHETIEVGPGSRPGNINWIRNLFDPTVAR